MANKVLLKKSSVAAKVPLTTDLDYGELALNYADGKLYFKNASNVIKSFTIDDSVVTLTGTQTLTNKTLTSPTINGGALSGTFSGAATLSGAITLSNTTASTSTSTGALTVGGGLGVAGSIYADQIRLTNNANGTNVYIGDDVVLGDVNAANTLGIRGNQDATKGYIVFGNANSTAYIGRDGTNPITVYGGQFSVNGTVANGGAALQLTGYASKGGTGYHDFLSATNTYGTATNPNKFFRLNNTGQLEIINSAYTATILTLTDAGVFSVPQISAGGSTGTNGQVLQSTGTGLQWASVGGTGTVTSITAGTGLTGGTITASGTIALATSGVTAGSYGSATAIPAITVDTYGRITSISTNAVSTTISLAGTTGTGSVAGGGTLTFASGNGVTATAATSTITINTPQDVRTTATPSFSTVTSTVATGTAPFTVTSTTKVANLNVEQVDGYHADTANTASTIAVRDASKNLAVSGVVLSGSTSGTSTLVASAAAGTTTHTLPAVTGTIITTGDTGTVTNAMLAGSIANAKLANSTISGVALGSNLNTLTLNVSGTGLSGSTTYNGSAAATFTVTSNATSANTASAIVARDASGNFSAGTITAALSGNATTATTATNLANGSAGTIPYQTGAGATAMLAAGTSGYFLKANGAAAPSWVELSLTDLPDAWVKKSVRVATTANITLSGTQTIDGIAVVAGDRVLVKDQTTASQNGIYVVAAGAWSRSTDANTISKLAGALVNVDSGTVSGGLRYDTDLKATDTLDTTAVSFYKAYDTNDAATANTASKLVLRDASGNFSAGTITAALSGNASTATTLQTARTINGVSFNGSANITVTASTTNALTIGTGLSGTSFNGSSAVTIALAASGVTAASYGSASNIPILTVDTYGRVTAASTASLTKSIVYGTRSGNVTVSVTGASSFTVATRAGNVSVPISL